MKSAIETVCRVSDYRNVMGGEDYEVNSMNVAVHEERWDMLVGGQLTPNGDTPRAFAYLFRYTYCDLMWTVQFLHLDEIRAVAWTPESTV